MGNQNHHRRSIRLPGYNYARPGAYFVTVCTHDRQCLFGDVVDGDMRENQNGRWARKCGHEIPVHFPHVDLDEFVVMPNHVHGIVVIPHTVGAKNFSPLQNGTPFRTPSRTIGSVVRGYKIGVTKWITRRNAAIYNVWQRNYYEHVIRGYAELDRIRAYIRFNPANWGTDENHPRPAC